MKLPEISRYMVYIAASISLITGIVVDAYTTHRQFFPTVVFLTNSKLFAIAGGNACIAALCVCASGVRKLFFGQLMREERERLTDQCFYHFIETLVALTYFRHAVSRTVTVMFLLTGCVKMLHVLCAARQETLERTRLMPMAVLKLGICLSILFSIDCWTTITLTQSLYNEGVSVNILLLLEFALMAVSAAVTTAKLLLHALEVRQGDAWEGRGGVKFYVELFSDVTSCVLYVAFFATMCRVSSVPLHLVREVIVTVRGTLLTVRNFLRYRRLTQCIDRAFRDATPAELDADRTCSICYDDMLDGAHCKRLPCGHIYHRNCLRRWFEKHAICPYCRLELDTAAIGADRLDALRNAAGAPNAAAQRQAAAEAVQMRIEELEFEAAYADYLARLARQQQPPRAQAAAPDQAVAQHGPSTPVSAPPAPVPAAGTSATPVFAPLQQLPDDPRRLQELLQEYKAYANTVQQANEALQHKLRVLEAKWIIEDK